MKTKIKHIITLTLVAILSLGCNKAINKGEEYTVEGRLMYNCETPMANTEFSFIQGSPGLIEVKNPLSLTVKTDAEGYFKIVYNGKNANISDFKIRKSGTIMNNIPVFENIDLENVYFDVPPFNFIRRLKVNNPYTVNDTLIIPDHNNQSEPFAFKYVVGPFTNGVIDTVWNHSPLGIIPFTYKETPEYRPYFRLTSEHSWRESSIVLNVLCYEGVYDVDLVLD